MKVFLSLLALFWGNFAFSECSEAYKKHLKSTIVSPATAPAMSTTETIRGAASSVAGTISGIVRFDVGLTTAGSINGTAFTYEGQSYLEMMSSNINHYIGRKAVYRIIDQAKLGMGEELEALYEDLSQSSSQEIFYETYVDLINRANENRELCPENKELFNLANLRNLLFYRLNLKAD